jgi:hypothetical protein
MRLLTANRHKALGTGNPQGFQQHSNRNVFRERGNDGSLYHGT